MNDPKIIITVRDEKTVIVRPRLSPQEVVHLARVIEQLGADGYALDSVDDIPGGTQRDPLTIGMRLLFKKEQP